MSQETNAASRFHSLLASERPSADLYSGLADATTGERRKVLSELAAVERKHAAHLVLRSNGWSRPSQACATAVALPENDWLQ
jgi:rubrerythrin